MEGGRECCIDEPVPRLFTIFVVKSLGAAGKVCSSYLVYSSARQSHGVNRTSYFLRRLIHGIVILPQHLRVNVVFSLCRLPRSILWFGSLPLAGSNVILFVQHPIGQCRPPRPNVSFLTSRRPGTLFEFVGIPICRFKHNSDSPQWPPQSSGSLFLFLLIS